MKQTLCHPRDLEHHPHERRPDAGPGTHRRENSTPRHLLFHVNILSNPPNTHLGRLSVYLIRELDSSVSRPLRHGSD